VANLETGRRAMVSVEEMFALAYVLNVAPVHLMVPPVDKDDHTPYQIVPNDPIQKARPFPDAVRAWIRGNLHIGTDMKRYFTEVPDSEWTPPMSAAESKRIAAAWPDQEGERGDR
jgi:hypothetical protein